MIAEIKGHLEVRTDKGVVLKFDIPMSAGKCELVDIGDVVKRKIDEEMGRLFYAEKDLRARLAHTEKQLASAVSALEKKQEQAKQPTPAAQPKRRKSKL